ncbi:MAG: hypothetical protein AAF351_12005 [Pseudomonadota bacterium]
MSDNEKRSKARGVRSMSMEHRKIIGNAIIDGLVDPARLNVLNPLATEGGDYDQNGGEYNQSGGGNHDQGGGGGYNQSASTGLDAALINIEPTDLINLAQRIEKERSR